MSGNGASEVLIRYCVPLTAVMRNTTVDCGKTYSVSSVAVSFCVCIRTPLSNSSPVSNAAKPTMGTSCQGMTSLRMTLKWSGKNNNGNFMHRVKWCKRRWRVLMTFILLNPVFCAVVVRRHLPSPSARDLITSKKKGGICTDYAVKSPHLRANCDLRCAPSSGRIDSDKGRTDWSGWAEHEERTHIRLWQLVRS